MDIELHTLSPQVMQELYQEKNIWILLTHSAMHGIPVTITDVHNAYLQAQTYENHYGICGPKSGLENNGKKAIIKRAIWQQCCR